MNNQRHPILDKLYMLVLVLMPVLAQYRIGPLDLDVVMMAVLLLIFLITSQYLTITRFNGLVLGIILYIIGITALNLFFGEKFSKESEIILRAGRYCLYLLVVFFFGNKHVGYADLMRIYRVIAYAASIYILIQAVFYYGAGITLPNKIGGTSQNTNMADVGRLRSFYSEPAELGYNLLPFIACSLFGEPYQKNGKNSGYQDALLVTVAVVVSTSGQGVIAAITVWALWFVVHVFRGDMKFRDVMLVIGVAIAAVIPYSTGILEYTLGRVESGSDDTGAIAARSTGYDSLSLLSPLQLVFGTGFGNYVVENRYGLDMVYEFVNYSSIAEFLFTLGILGILLWVIFFTRIFCKGNLCSKVLLIAMVVLSLYGCPMTGKHFPLWLTLMCVQLPKGLFVPEKRVETAQYGKGNFH